jgi:pimeloyl-ACP methyl ester carboxylesterase
MTQHSNPDNILHLHDGRRLGYAEYGAPDGKPVLYFHGAPGSRRSLFAEMAEVGAQRGIRLIVPERPGYGLSDPLNGRSVGDWTNDVLALTNALGIDRFKLIGFSMGSLYALACAQALPAQVERVAIVGGLAPLNVAGVDAGRPAAIRDIYDLARSDPHGLRVAMAPLAGSAAGLVETMASLASAVDKELLSTRVAEFEMDFAETLRGGVDGVVCDILLAANEWTFPLEHIPASVDLWVGTEDCNTPPAMTRHLASVLPHSQVFELPGEGHFCLYSHWHEILGSFSR